MVTSFGSSGIVGGSSGLATGAGGAAGGLGGAAGCAFSADTGPTTVFLRLLCLLLLLLLLLFLLELGPEALVLDDFSRGVPPPRRSAGFATFSMITLSHTVS